MIKGREVRELLGRENIPPNVLRVLVELAEHQSVVRQQIQELSMLVDKISDLTVSMVDVVGTIKADEINKANDKMNKIDPQE